jgi:hypothetical protein
MAFDPNQPFETEEDGGGFDPNKEFTPLDTDSPADDRPSVLGVVGRGAAQGVSFGFADEAMAGIQAPFSDKTYQELRDTKRQQLETDRKAFPKTAITSEIGGAVLPTVAAALSGAGTPAAAANTLRIGNVARSVLNPRTIKGMMGAGAAFGLGGSEADLTEGDVGGAALDAGKGAAFAGALGKALPAATKYGGEVMDYLGKKFGSGAESLAGSAMGLTKGLRKKFDLSPVDVRAAGREGLDTGIVSPLADAETMALRAAAEKGRIGSEIGSVIDVAEAMGGTPNAAALISALEKKAAPYAGTNVGKQTYNQIMSVIEDIKANPNLSPTKLQQYKIILGEEAYPKGVMAESKEGFQKAFTPVKQELETTVGQSVSPEQKGVYESLKKRFGIQETIEEGLTEKVAQAGNRKIGLTDFIVGTGAGASIGGPLGFAGAIATVGAKKGIEKYGLQTGAVSMDRIGKLLQSTPQVFGSYGPMIQQAIQRGGTAFATQNFLLQQRDPEYRKMMEEVSNMKQEGEE